MENINKRISVRNFADDSLHMMDQLKIKKISEETYDSIFNHQFDFHLVDQRFLSKHKVKRVGTYGFITGQPSYIFAGVKHDYKSVLDYGYQLEQMVLKLTELDFSTCWLGGTFNRKVLKKLYKLEKNIHIPAVIAVGQKSPKKNFVQNLMGSNYHNRKEFHLLFFNEEPFNPLDKTHSGVFSEPLEALRLAPSSMNHQPWRVIKQGNTIHFYCEVGQESDKSFIARSLDMGIGLCHFDLRRKDLGIEGAWETLEHKDIHKLKYVISFVSQ